MAAGEKSTGPKRTGRGKSSAKSDTPAPDTARSTADEVATATAAADGGAGERAAQLERASAAAPPEHDTMGQVNPEQTTAGIVGVAPPATAPDAPVPGPLPPATAGDPAIVPTPPGDVAEDPPGEGKWVLFNPTDGPVVYDDAGHIVGGGERVQVDVVAKDSPAQRAIDMGRLVKRKAAAES